MRKMSDFFVATDNSRDEAVDVQKRGLSSVCQDLRAFHVLRKGGKYKSAGHWIQQEQAEVVNDLLLAFFQDAQDAFDRAPGGAAGVEAKL